MLRANKRIQKELARIETEGQTDGITVKVIDHDVWHIKFEGPRGIYSFIYIIIILLLNLFFLIFYI